MQDEANYDSYLGIYKSAYSKTFVDKVLRTTAQDGRPPTPPHTRVTSATDLDLAHQAQQRTGPLLSGHEHGGAVGRSRRSGRLGCHLQPARRAWRLPCGSSAPLVSVIDVLTPCAMDAATGQRLPLLAGRHAFSWRNPVSGADDSCERLVRAADETPSSMRAFLCLRVLFACLFERAAPATPTTTTSGCTGSKPAIRAARGRDRSATTATPTACMFPSCSFASGRGGEPAAFVFVCVGRPWRLWTSCCAAVPSVYLCLRLCHCDVSFREHSHAVHSLNGVTVHCSLLDAPARRPRTPHVTGRRNGYPFDGRWMLVVARSPLRCPKAGGPMGDAAGLELCRANPARPGDPDCARNNRVADSTRQQRELHAV